MDAKDQKHNAQNRLLIASAVLTFLYYAEAKFQGVSAIGASIVFKNEDAVQEFAWIIWGYYFIRTYQYYKESGVEAFRHVINQGYVANIGHLILGIKEHEFKLLPNEDPIKSSVIRIGIGAYSNIDRVVATQNLAGYWLAAALAPLVRQVTEFRTPELRRPSGSLVTINFLSRFAQYGATTRRVMRWLNPLSAASFGVRAVVYPPTSKFEQQGQHKFFVKLPVWALYRVLAVYLRTILLRPQFTENQVPLIVGLAPVWYLIALRHEPLIATLRSALSLVVAAG